VPPWRRRPDADFAAEIEAHLALEVDALAREGVSIEDASAHARKTFGNIATSQERFYDSQRSAWLERIRHDFLGAVRQLRRSPAFTAVATLTLALGIGLSAAVFSVANAVLIRRLPVMDQNRLVLLSGESVDGKNSKIPLTLDGVHALQRRSRSIESSAFYSFRGAVPAPIRFGDMAFPIQLGLVSGNIFNVLGSTAEIGRSVRADDDVAGAAPVVVLSHRAWLRDFNGDRGIVGKSVTMVYTNRSYRIVGVMPLGLDLPRGTGMWAPLVAYGSAGGFLDALTGELNVLARLRQNASASQARAELTDFLTESDFPGSRHGTRGAAELLSAATAGELKPAVEFVSVIVALFLVLMCVNVANLLLVRALSRERELMLRSALGADRSRLVSQLLAESCLLSIMGGCAGVALASVVIRVFVIVSPANAPRVDEIHMDGATLVVAIVLTSIATLMFGLGPALLASRSVDHGSPPTASRHTHGRQSRMVAVVLVIAQIALAVTTLASAALVTRSLMKLERLDLSFDPHHLTVASLAMSADRSPDAHAPREALDALVANIGALPGVQAVTPVATIPFVGDGGGIDSRMSIAGQSSDERALNPVEDLEVAAPNYFTTLGIPLLRGRAFGAEDRSGSPRVIIVSRSVAHRFWPGMDPIGKRLSDSHDEFTIVGEVSDTR
jgi:putative ABC transport system permease protein